jgi:hypothetical protein
MHIVVVSYQRMRQKYGEERLARLRCRIAMLQQARLRRGLASAVLVVEQGDAARGVAEADPSSADAIKRQLEALADALERQGQQLRSVLLVGGPDVLPFHMLGNPLLDSEGVLAADYLYGLHGYDELATEWSVGRLPDGAGNDASQLLRLLGLAVRHHRCPPRPVGRAFGYSTATWQQSSRAVFQALGATDELLLSPPCDAARLPYNRLAAAARLYFNLHGVRDGAAWYGQTDDGRRSFVVALRPHDLDGLNLLGAVALSEACYGAYSPQFDLAGTLALALLLRGVACFVGATDIAYGAARPPLSEADLLAAAFLQASLTPGISAGAAFQQARHDAMRTTLLRQGFLDDDDTKTLMQFVLYGDPTIQIGPLAA